jgi:hypothetical protein
MPRIYSRRDNGFEDDMMNTMGPMYVPVQEKYNAKTGQTVQRVGAVNTTPLTYSEDDYVELAGVLYYGNKINLADIRNSLRVLNKARTVMVNHPDEAQILDEIQAVDTAVSNNKLKNYAKNAFQTNENLAFIEGVGGNGNISLKSVCADLQKNFNAFARHFHDADRTVLRTWTDNILKNTLDSMQLQFLTEDFIRLILETIIDICTARRSFKTQDLQDGRRRRRSKRSKRSKSKKSRSKSVDGKKRRSKKSRSKRSKKSRSKSVDGKRRSKKSRSKKSKRSRSKSVDGKRRRSKKSKSSRRHRSRKSRSRSMSAKKLLKLLRKM